MVLNLEPLKEPRGFIRIIQIFMAILAFATTTSFDADARVNIECRNTTENNKLLDVANASYHFGYPFESQVSLQFKFSSPKCSSNPNEVFLEHKFKIDKKASSEFYVTTGVLSFLFALAVGVVYVLLTDVYENTPIFPFIDLVATGILAFFWFMSWCIWVAQSNNVKSDFNEIPNGVQLEIPKVHPPNINYECLNALGVNFSKLTVSLVFGFGNIILWAGSVWFVYKETNFHRSRELREQYTTDANGPHHIPSPHQQFP